MKCGDDLTGKLCVQCDELLLNGKSIVFDGYDILHKVCHERAQRAFAGAMHLARLGMAVQAYIAHREDMGIAP